MALYLWITSYKWLDYGLTGISIVGLVIVVAIYHFQSKLIYVPHFPPGSRNEIWRPSKFGFDQYEEVTLASSDGVKLHCYWIPNQKGLPLKSVPTILFLHANAGNMGHRLPIAQRIADVVNVNVFMLSYRGYGKSEGEPEEKGIRKDAQCALEYLLEKLGSAQIIVYGQSIGGAVALDLVARNQSKIAGVIIENTFLSLRKLIPHVVPLLGWASLLCHQRWESEERLMEMVNTPPLPKMLFLSGGSDELIPPQHMHQLFAITTLGRESEGRAKFVSFPTGTHNDTFLQAGYFEAITDFIKDLQAPSDAKKGLGLSN